jgi:hypothetical protein
MKIFWPQGLTVAISLLGEKLIGQCLVHVSQYLICCFAAQHVSQATVPLISGLSTIKMVERSTKSVSQRNALAFFTLFLSSSSIRYLPIVPYSTRTGCFESR